VCKNTVHCEPERSHPPLFDFILSSLPGNAGQQLTIRTMIQTEVLCDYFASLGERAPSHTALDDPAWPPLLLAVGVGAACLAWALRTREGGRCTWWVRRWGEARLRGLNLGAKGNAGISRISLAYSHMVVPILMNAAIEWKVYEPIVHALGCCK
jgi:hypothetical protein